MHNETARASRPGTLVLPLPKRLSRSGWGQHRQCAGGFASSFPALIVTKGVAISCRRRYHWPIAFVWTCPARPACLPITLTLNRLHEPLSVRAGIERSRRSVRRARMSNALCWVVVLRAFVVNGA